MPGNARSPHPEPTHHRPPAPCHTRGAGLGGPGRRPRGARPARPVPCSPSGCERIPCAAGSAARPLALKTELFLSELKRDVSQQPAFLPGSNTSCQTPCPLLSPPGAGEGCGGHRHGRRPFTGHPTAAAGQAGQPAPAARGPPSPRLVAASTSTRVWGARLCSPESTWDPTAFAWRWILARPGWGRTSAEGRRERGMGGGGEARAEHPASPQGRRRRRPLRDPSWEVAAPW